MHWLSIKLINLTYSSIYLFTYLLFLFVLYRKVGGGYAPPSPWSLKCQVSWVQKIAYMVTMATEEIIKIEIKYKTVNEA